MNIPLKWNLPEQKWNVLCCIIGVISAEWWMNFVLKKRSGEREKKNSRRQYIMLYVKVWFSSPHIDDIMIYFLKCHVKCMLDGPNEIYLSRGGITNVKNDAKNRLCINRLWSLICINFVICFIAKQYCYFETAYLVSALTWLW